MQIVIILSGEETGKYRGDDPIGTGGVQMVIWQEDIKVDGDDTHTGQGGFVTWQNDPEDPAVAFLEKFDIFKFFLFNLIGNFYWIRKYKI